MDRQAVNQTLAGAEALRIIDVLSDAGFHDAASNVLGSSLTISGAVSTGCEPYVAALEALVALRLATGEPQAALESAMKLHQVFQSQLGVGHPRYTFALQAWARSSAACGEPGHAATGRSEP